MAKRRLTERERDLIRARYIAGETQSGIAVALGVGARTVTEVLAASKITAKDRITSSPAARGAAPSADPAAIREYQGIGEPPVDSLSAIGWAQRGLAVAVEPVRRTWGRAS